MNASRALVAVLSIALLAGACAHGRNVPALAGSGQNQKATVEVINNGYTDVVVYAVRHGARMRLGMVTGLSRARLRIPKAALAGGTGLQLLADPIGSNDRFFTTPIYLMPGQNLELMLQENLAISSFSIR